MAEQPAVGPCSVYLVQTTLHKEIHPYLKNKRRLEYRDGVTCINFWKTYVATIALASLLFSHSILA